MVKVQGPLEGTKSNLFVHLKTTQIKKNKVDHPIATKKSRILLRDLICAFRLSLEHDQKLMSMHTFIHKR